MQKEVDGTKFSTFFENVQFLLNFRNSLTDVPKTGVRFENNLLGRQPRIRKCSPCQVYGGHTHSRNPKPFFGCKNRDFFKPTDLCMKNLEALAEGHQSAVGSARQFYRRPTARLGSSRNVPYALKSTEIVQFSTHPSQRRFFFRVKIDFYGQKWGFFKAEIQPTTDHVIGRRLSA